MSDTKALPYAALTATRRAALTQTAQASTAQRSGPTVLSFTAKFAPPLYSTFYEVTCDYPGGSADGNLVQCQ